MKNKVYKLIVFGFDLSQKNHGYNKYSMGARALAAATSNSLLVFPKHEGIEELKKLYADIFWEGRTDISSVFVDGPSFHLDENLLNSPESLAFINEKLEDARRKGFEIKILSYQWSPFLDQWTAKLKVPFSANIASKAWREEYSSKAIFHRHIGSPDTPGLVESRVPEALLTKGFVCDTPSEAKKAMGLLQDMGIKNILAKDTDNSGGKGIEQLTASGDVDGLPWEKKRYIITEKLDLDQNEIGTEANAAVFFHDNELFITPNTVIVKGFGASASVMPLFCNEEQRESLYAQIPPLLKWLNSTGMEGDGCVDFIFSQNKAYLVDNNLGRMGTTHFFIYFQKNYIGDDKAFSYFRIDPNKYGLGELWDKLQKNGLAFDPEKKTGVFPIFYVKGESGLMIAFSESNKEAYEMQQACLEII